MPRPVYEAVQAHLEREIAIGGYLAEDQAKDRLDQYYTEFAGLLGAEPSEIAYVENATRAWDMAFYSMPFSKDKTHILTHGSEYESNYLALLQQVKRRGLTLELVPSDATGQIDLQKLEDAITPQTLLIALTHVPTHSGLVNPAEAVGEIARRRGLIYLLDACQSAGQIDLDVGRLGCHALTGTGRKFLRAPCGTGFLYVSNELVDRMEPPFIDLRAAKLKADGGYDLQAGARRFENWESNVSGRIGLAQAVAYARSIGLSEIEKRVVGLADGLRAKLAGLSGVTVRDKGVRKCGIVTFRKIGADPIAMVAAFAKAGINASKTANPFDRVQGIPDSSAVRASIHYYNSEVEVVRFVEAVEAFTG